jgi:hypothetical protein
LIKFYNLLEYKYDDCAYPSSSQHRNKNTPDKDNAEIISIISDDIKNIENNNGDINKIMISATHNSH